ncbi:fibroblast growth factor 1-like isoform X2 [Atheta coriaria]|uniref:fibroblast growth factor 1-like isoform X2 n=1 Tax=Dalotia coriaria TaxID=877792 RepID=UPI0031F357EB
MYTLNDVASSESSADSDESIDDDYVDHSSSLQSTQSQSSYQSSSQMQMMETTRSKRSIMWCGVEDDGPSTSAPPQSGNLRSDQQGQRQRKPSLDPYEGVPLTVYVKGDQLQLFCRSKQFLGVYPDGKVRGTSDKADPHTRLEMIPTGFPGHVVIRGLLTNLYVTMNNKGRLRSQGNRDAEMSVFIEGKVGFYFYYLSRHFAFRGWYLGIKKSGKFKNGQKTKLNQKAVHFLKL